MRGRFGPLWHADRGTRFRLWAPAASRVELMLEHDTHPMTPQDDGWYALDWPKAGPGTRYRFRIDGDIAVPDPASHFQPEDVNGPSEVIDHDHAWLVNEWRGRPWHEAVILELHVGTFTSDGTFRAAIDRLGDVAAAGFTAIELMPVADFAGRRNWGYDGVLLYAPDSSYGRPEELKALVDAAHSHGLMVLLDVVYNHFGPEGNYLGRYAPEFFTKDHTTPWGAAIDYRVPEVRAFAVENALHWLDRYRFDGLRLDAVHAIVEPGTPSVLEELSIAVGELAGATGRYIHLVLENDDNRASLLDPLTEPAAGRYRAQWNDDYHHAWHVLLTGDSHGYYRDYVEDPKGKIAKSLAQGFIYQGEPSPHRNGAHRGEPSGTLPPGAFVNFLQNHDQIGNRALGDRMVALADPAAYECALTVLLLAPMPVLMFMGGEWGAPQPFPFFCDFQGELAEAVRKGRRREFAEAYADPAIDVPDPLAEETFRSAVLDWTQRDEGACAKRLELVQRLLQIRREVIVPRLAGMTAHEAEADLIAGPLRARWRLDDGSNLHVLANLSDAPCPCPEGIPAAGPIWGGTPPDQLPAWAVYWSLHEGGG
jgi:malto-oligosyltrehalose trehalohydrolase